jgi:hypothetical protein
MSWAYARAPTGHRNPRKADRQLAYLQAFVYRLGQLLDLSCQVSEFVLEVILDVVFRLCLNCSALPCSTSRRNRTRQNQAVGPTAPMRSHMGPERLEKQYTTAMPSGCLHPHLYNSAKLASLHARVLGAASQVYCALRCTNSGTADSTKFLIQVRKACQGLTGGAQVMVSRSSNRDCNRHSRQPRRSLCGCCKVTPCSC